MNLPTKQEWESLGFSVPSELCSNKEAASWAAGQVWKTEHNHLMLVENVQDDGMALIGMIHPYRTRPLTQKPIPEGWVRII